MELLVGAGLILRMTSTDTSILSEKVPAGVGRNRLRETRLPGRLDQSFKGLEMIATAAVAVAQTPQSMEIAEPACQWDKPDPVSPRGTHGAIGGRGAGTAHDEYRHFEPERKSSRQSRPKPFTSTKKGARIFTPEQQQVLKAVYAENQYPSRDDIQRLARAFQQPEAKLTTWFNNRRARVRRSQRNQRVSPSTRRYGSEQSATALSSQSMERCASECVTSATGHQTVPLARKSSRRESIFDTESTALAAHIPEFDESLWQARRPQCAESFRLWRRILQETNGIPV
jgi:hypothetical protein